MISVDFRPLCFEFKPAENGFDYLNGSEEGVRIFFQCFESCREGIRLLQQLRGCEGISSYVLGFPAKNGFDYSGS